MDPIAGEETPDEKDDDAEDHEHRTLHEQLDLSTGFKARPDGTLEPPKTAPLIGGKSSASQPSSAATIPPSPTMSSEVWQRVGPGPFAEDAIPASLWRKADPSMQRRLNETGYRYGCHRCGSKVPGSKSGNYFADH